MARAGRARAGRIDRDDAVLRCHADRSCRATQPLAVARTRKSASSDIVSAMRGAVAGATLILTVFGGPGLAACAVLSLSTPETKATQSAPATPGVVLPRVRLVATGVTISNLACGELAAEYLVTFMPRL